MKQEELKALGISMEVANNSITSARTVLSTVLSKMLGNKKHTFKQFDVYVTDEENCSRELIKSCDKDAVYFHDGSSLEIGEIGTDDLHNVVDMVRSELMGLVSIKEA